MLLNTKVKHAFTFDHYEYAEGTTDDNAIIYKYKESLTGTFVSGRSQTYLFLKTQIPVADKVLGAKDRDGNNIFTARGVEYDMYINESEPVFDIYGKLTGYRHTLRRRAPISAGEVGHSG